jgi:hypothetical protein
MTDIKEIKVSIVRGGFISLLVTGGVEKKEIIIVALESDPEVTEL